MFQIWSSHVPQRLIVSQLLKIPIHSFILHHNSNVLRRTLSHHAITPTFLFKLLPIMASPLRFAWTDPCAHTPAPLCRSAHTRSDAKTHLRSHPSHTRAPTLQTHTIPVGSHNQHAQTCLCPHTVNTHAHTVNPPCTQIRAHTLHPHTIVRTHSRTEMVKPFPHLRAHTRARTHVCPHTPTHTCKHTLHRHSRQPSHT
jgi:hypothetical protein